MKWIGGEENGKGRTYSRYLLPYHSHWERITDNNLIYFSILYIFLSKLFIMNYNGD